MTENADILEQPWSQSSATRLTYLTGYCIKQINSISPYVCSVIDQDVKIQLANFVFVLTTFWRHLWSTTEPADAGQNKIYFNNV